MEFPPLSPVLRSYQLLEKVLEFSQRKKVRLYLVGGILRDILLKRQKADLDFDFCLKRSAISFGRALAQELRAGFVVLDREHGCCRLVKTIEGKNYTLDFADFRAETVEKDLFHRDFTINALALELEKVFLKEADSFLIDPYKGRKDLEWQIIRSLNSKTFDEDPLRILRAFSLSCVFGFKIDAATLRSIKAKKNLLAEVSYERIRDELFKVLDQPDSHLYLEQMDKLGILKIIIPEIEVMRNVGQGPYHHLDVWKHTQETIRQLEKLCIELKAEKEIQGYLNETISSQRRRLPLLKLGALLHDIGKPKTLRRLKGKIIFHGHERAGLRMTEEISRRLKLSNDEILALHRIVLWHLRPGYLADNAQVTARASFRYFRDTALEAVGILLLSIADQRATKGRLTSKVSRLRQEKVAFGLIKEYFRKQKQKIIPRLISGDDLMRVYKLEPSPLIGKILREIEELQAIGKITTKKQALDSVRKFL